MYLLINDEEFIFVPLKDNTFGDINGQMEYLMDFIGGNETYNRKVYIDNMKYKTHYMDESYIDSLYGDY